MLTVGNDAARVERMLEKGSLVCPVCGGRLARWGYALERTVFGPGRQGRAVRPRRSRCTACGVTHVLLPARLLLRRAAGRAGQVREVFTKVAAAVSADPVPLEPAGSPLADALVAVAAAAAAAAERGPRLLAVSPWEIAAAVTNATLLAPVMAAGMFNASSLS